MGVAPEIWGPNLWGTLHLLCLAGTITPNFVQEFATVIPCPMCAGHFADVLKENPFPDSDDSLVLFRWSVHVHNLVNSRLGKPMFSPEQAMERWMTMSQVQTSSSQFDFKIVVIILLVLALVFMLLRSKL
jgi:Erv1 / Alr family